MKKILITNNPLVYSQYRDNVNFMFSSDWSFLDVLKRTRNKIHDGHELLTHPLSGSIKPNETPYKSIIISHDSKTLNMQSLQIIEESISTAEKFLKNRKPSSASLTDEILKDFQFVDFGLIKDSVER